LHFGRAVRLGTIEAIRQQVLRGRGVGVLPAYFVRRDLAAKRLATILPKVRALSDFFRLVVRADDPRRSFLAGLANLMKSHPLQ
jgi:LysR family transcriptional regulator, glycine cleavage system transcriptional activator